MQQVKSTWILQLPKHFPFANYEECFMFKLKRIYSDFEVRTTIFFLAKELNLCSVSYKHIIYACDLKLY